MENTLSDTEKGYLPTADEKALLTKLREMGFTFFLGAPELADVDQVVDDQALADGALVIAAQLDVPRNLTYALTDGNDSASGVVTVVGKDMLGRAVSEVWTITAGVSKAMTGTIVFASITSVTASACSGNEGGDLVNIGCGNVIGVPMDIDDSDEIRHVYLGNARVTTPTIVTGEHTSGINVSASTYDGSKYLVAIVQPTRTVPNPD